MQIDISTPALLFPAISLLMLAYTNRFLAIANIIRELRHHYLETRDPLVYDQIKNLKHRVVLIRNMQWFGAMSMLFCVVSMGFRFAEWNATAGVLFAISLVLMTFSLLISIFEIQQSVVALEINLKDMEELETSIRAKEAAIPISSTRRISESETLAGP